MSIREKSAWAMAGTLVVTFGWYLTSVVSQMGEGSVTEVAYQVPAVIAAVAVVVLAALSHAVFAATGRTEETQGTATTIAIKRYARSTGGVVVSVAAVLGMALAMVEADHFWTANVLLGGLVVAEVVSAGSEIHFYRRSA